MAFQTMKLYVATFKIDGVEHVMRGYTPDEKTLKKHLKQIIDARNANIEEEQTELGEVLFDVTEDKALQVEEAARARNPDNTTADELHPDAPALLLHKPVHPVE